MKASRWYLDNPDHKVLFNNRISELALWIAKEKANQSKIEWDDMPNLEDVYLDWRGLFAPTNHPSDPIEDVEETWGYRDMHFVAKIAKAMRGKKLRRLVIAGLRSYVGPQGYDACGLRKLFQLGS